MASLEVIIIGGGIGGLCLGQSLKAAGVNFTIYERNQGPTDWLEGYRIHINPVGSGALFACLPPVLWEAFRAITGKPGSGIGFLTEQLKELVVIAGETIAADQANPQEGHYPVSRMALRHLLLTGLEDRVCYDRTFERYEPTPDGRVRACFADGTSAIADTLIGADGANSRVCRQYLPLARRVETGGIAVGGKLLLNDRARSWLPAGLATRMNIVWPPKECVLFNAVFERKKSGAAEKLALEKKIKAANLNPDLLFDATEDYILWAFIARASSYPRNVEAFDGEALHCLVSERVKSWHPLLQRLIVESDQDSLTLVPLKATKLIEPWKTTNVTVLGDAIHSMTPVLGLGANMALRDASVLGSKLKAVSQGKTPLLTAINEYEAQMRNYAYNAVRASVNYSNQMISRNRLARTGAKTWFRICKTIPALRISTLERQFTRNMQA